MCAKPSSISTTYTVLLLTHKHAQILQVQILRALHRRPIRFRVARRAGRCRYRVDSRTLHSHHRVPAEWSAEDDARIAEGTHTSSKPERSSSFPPSHGLIPTLTGVEKMITHGIRLLVPPIPSQSPIPTPPNRTRNPHPNPNCNPCLQVVDSDLTLLGLHTNGCWEDSAEALALEVVIAFSPPLQACHLHPHCHRHRAPGCKVRPLFIALISEAVQRGLNVGVATFSPQVTLTLTLSLTLSLTLNIQPGGPVKPGAGFGYS